jgi:C4-dicarboxylate-specific signal transduction histidine kinase
MTTFTSDQWIILALVFILGLLVGMFLTAGGRRKWRTRYKEESTRRETLEREHQQHRAQMDEREKEWRDQDARRAAAIKDSNRDGVPDDRPL